MGIIGKIVGGTIGFALGGPLGAVAGTAFGHILDRSNVALEPSAHSGRLSMLEASQLAFFVGTFSMLAKLAKADGHLRQEEIASVKAFAVQDLGLSPENQEVAFNIFRAALDSPASFEDFAVQFYQRFQHQRQMIEMMIDILLRVSAADGSINRAEETLILSAVRIFNLPPGRFEQLRSRYAGRVDHAYHVLGCRREDSDEQIKRCYRRLVHAYHPDKIAGKGLPEEFLHLAQDKFREIKAAYEYVKSERGFK